MKGRGRAAGYREIRTTTVKWERKLRHALCQCGGGMGACIEEGKSSGGVDSGGDIVLINNAQSEVRVNS